VFSNSLQISQFEKKKINTKTQRVRAQHLKI